MSEEGEGVRIKYIYFSSMSEEGESVRGKIKKKKCTTYKNDCEMHKLKFRAAHDQSRLYANLARPLNC